jgi:hypothetical protein
MGIKKYSIFTEESKYNILKILKNNKKGIQFGSIKKQKTVKY